MLTRVDCAFMLLCSISAVASGCGEPSGATCTIDSDCASGFCKADGTCGPAPVDAPMQSDAAIDGTMGLCNPNHDSMITLAELPFMAGRMGTFRVTVDATWNTAGMSNTDGSRAWDLSGQLAGDADRMMVLGAPTGMDDSCDPLTVCRTEWDGMPVVVSCWKVTPEELAEIQRTGRVWLAIWGESMPPAWVGTKSNLGLL